MEKPSVGMLASFALLAEVRNRPAAWAAVYMYGLTHSYAPDPDFRVRRRPPHRSQHRGRRPTHRSQASLTCADQHSQEPSKLQARLPATALALDSIFSPGILLPVDTSYM